MIPRSILNAWRMIEGDQAYLSDLFPQSYIRRSRLRSLLLDAGVRAAFYMRACAEGGPLVSLWAGAILRRQFASQASPGLRVEGGLYLPHPVGIVLGAGVVIGPRVTIFQGVTLGQDGKGNYPVIGSDVIIFPNSVVVGNVVIDEATRVPAQSFLSPNRT